MSGVRKESRLRCLLLRNQNKSPINPIKANPPTTPPTTGPTETFVVGDDELFEAADDSAELGKVVDVDERVKLALVVKDRVAIPSPSAAFDKDFEVVVEPETSLCAITIALEDITVIDELEVKLVPTSDEIAADGVLCATGIALVDNTVMLAALVDRIVEVALDD